MYNTKTPQVKQLSPSLAEIENYLFAPSFGLCQLVYNNDPSINVNIANGIKNSVAYKNFVETMEEQNSTRSNENFLADDNNNINFDEEVEIPNFIKNLISRRCAANSIAKQAEAGQIIRITKLPKSMQNETILQYPIYVLLNKKVDETNDENIKLDSIWHGYLCVSETEYASSFDAVLQENNGNFDPEAAMVQTWNPIQVDINLAKDSNGNIQLSGQINTNAMNAIRSLAKDAIFNVQDNTIPSWLGKVAVRQTSEGFDVVTGSPLMKKNDPREIYQNMYFKVANEAIKPMTKIAISEYVAQQKNMQISANSFIMKQIIKDLYLIGILQKFSRVKFTMAGKNNADNKDDTHYDFVFDNIVKFTPLRGNSDSINGSEIEITVIDNKPLKIIRIDDDDVEKEYIINANETQRFSFDDNDVKMIFITADNQKFEVSFQ